MTQRDPNAPAVVVYVNAVSWVSGIEMSLVELIDSLDRRRYTPVVVLPGPGLLADMLRQRRVAVRCVPFYGLKARNPLRYFQTLLGMARVFRQHNAAIVHVMHQYCAAYGVLAARLARRKVISHIHGLDSEKFIPWANRADGTIVTTNLMRDRLTRAGLRSDGRLWVVYPGVKLPSSSDTEEPEIPPVDGPVIGFVGQLALDKGLLELANAAPRILAGAPEARFRLVGGAAGESSEFVDSLRAEIRSMGLADRFEFLGFKRNLESVYRSFDVTAVPSWEEPFGRVVVESMLAGTPVVATRAGGVPEIITSSSVGVLVEPRDSAALAAGILQVLGMDARDRQSMIDEARTRAAHFSVESNTRQTQNVYDQILGC